MKGADAIPERTFGRFLAETGVVTDGDLEETTQSMVLFGGRLGTSLVEAGILTVRQLEEQLAAYHGLDPVPPDWMEHPDPGARAAIPNEMIARHSAYPLSFQKRTLHVGLMDPRDHAVIDELAFSSGCLIVPYAVPECRFAQLMERGLGVKPSIRFSNLMREAESARQMRQAAPTDASDPAKAEELAKEEDSQFSISPLAAEIDLVDEETFDELHQRAAAPAPAASAPDPAPAVQPPAAAASAAEDEDGSWDLSGESGKPAASPQAPPVPRPGPAEIALLEQVLLETPQREDVIQAAVRIASSYAELAALFVVRAEMATGARAWCGGDWIDIDSIMIPAVTGCVLAEAAVEKRIARAKPETQLDLRLAKAMGREGTRELVAFPVLLGGRVVNLLLVDAGASPLSRTAMSALGELAPMIASSYERLIVLRKQTSG